MGLWALSGKIKSAGYPGLSSVLRTPCPSLNLMVDDVIVDALH